MTPMPTLNPELKRLLWLEVSVQRLWLTPAAILGTALLLTQSGAAPLFVRSLAMIGFVLITVIGGARQAAAAVLDEARDHTWEIQRMSALSPWTMTWGKLIGATLMPWYGGAMCLALFVIHHPGAHASAIAWSAFAALLALTAQAFALCAALVRVHLERRVRARLSIVIVMFLLSLVLPELAQLAVPGFGPLRDIGGVISWYGRVYPGMAFNLALLGAFAAWAVMGAYRMMCLELDVRTTPWVWLAFIAFLALVFSGFGDGGPSPDLARRWLSSAALFACALTYVAGFAFARDPVQYRRAWAALAAGRLRRALEELPLAVSSALYTVVLALLACVVGSDHAISNERIDNLGPVALALAVMMLRDLGLLLFFSFRQHARRAEITTLLYLAMLNRVLPAMAAAAGLGQLALMVKPALFAAPATAILVALVHATVALGLALAGYRAALPAPPRTPPPRVNQPGDRKS